VNLQLSATFTPNALATPLLSGKVAPEGITLVGSTMNASEMYWRQLKFAEFDVSEMSMSSLIIATSLGPTDYVALPVFTMRRFFHTNIVVRGDAGIATPAGLRGKRIGVPEYQQTSAVWTRGILADEFGVSAQDIVWYMERPPEASHGGTTGFVPPPGVELHYISPQTNIGEMLVNGGLDGSLSYLSAPNLIDRSRIDINQHREIGRLFPDVVSESRRYYAKTGLFPINHVLVVRRSLLEAHPWIALNLYDAFVTAKDQLRRERDARLEVHITTGLIDDTAVEGLKRDPMPYGLAGARRELETIARYDYEQGLCPRIVTVEELFPASTLGT
jgi:4,5-dihydroxyphthalate decarboxylase